MHDPTNAANTIRQHLARVVALRNEAHQRGLAEAVHQVKQLQGLRFRGTYTDFLSQPRFAPATRFFLDELYGEHDFSERDRQFARIAGALERLFPPAVSALAVDLTETHALTELLDHEVSSHWLRLPDNTPHALRYVRSWRATGQHDARQRQLMVVQHMGNELQRLTRNASLRMGLRMMRGPAQLAGLSALQGFLESGFDAFATMRDASSFLSAIEEREQDWIETLFHAPEGVAAQALEAEWA
ncbi:MAG: FFLEELY motif protein [Hydrogenophaga sp.]